MRRLREIFRTSSSLNLPQQAARAAGRWYGPIVAFLGSPSGSASYNFMLFAMGAGKPVHPTNYMPQTQPSTPHLADSFGSGMRRRVRGGFTLAETMMATLIFSVGILGVYAMMLKSYELVTLARHRDNSRAMLESFSDQFLRLQTTDQDPFTGQTITRPLFVTTSTPTGVGLNWTDASGNLVSGNAAGLAVTLGESASSRVPAVVTRSVTNLDNGTGATAGSVTATAAGWLLQATFTITYQIKGSPQTQSYIVARSVR